MVIEQLSEEHGVNTASEPAGPQILATVQKGEEAHSPDMTEMERKEMKSRAESLVQDLMEARGSKQLELTDGLTNLGVQAQRTAGKELELLRVRVGEMLTQDGTGSEIGNNMVQLRTTLNRISPDDVSKGGLIRRTFGKIPLLGDPAVKALEKAAMRYESVGEQVTVIESRLRDGRQMLARDNIELKNLYQQVEQQQLPIQRNAYLGSLVMEEVERLTEQNEDPLERERLRNVLHDVSMRVQDLRTMEEVHIQFFLSIEMTRQNNNRLGQTVERTLALGTNIVMVGLAIQTALHRQKKVMEATQKTQEFLGNLVVANASAIRRHTEEIGDIYNNPVIAIDKITQAHGELIDAMNAADRIKQEGIQTAKENIARLSQLSTDLREQAEETSSVEA